MRRRSVLASLPAAASLGGCLGESSAIDTPSPAGTPTGDAASTDVAGSSAEPPPAVAVRSALRYLVGDDAIGVEPPDGDQFAFVRPPDVGDDPPPDAFALELGDRRFVPRSSVPGFMLRTPGVDAAYTEADRSGWLVFDVETVGAEAGALVHGGTSRPLPGDSLPAFAAAPDFSLRDVGVPDAVAAGGLLPVTVTVANRGGREGTFLAGVQRDGRPEAVDVRVPAGEVAEGTVRLAVPDDPGDVVRFRFVHAGGRASYEVPVDGDGG